MNDNKLNIRFLNEICLQSTVTQPQSSSLFYKTSQKRSRSRSGDKLNTSQNITGTVNKIRINTNTNKYKKLCHFNKTYPVLNSLFQHLYDIIGIKASNFLTINTLQKKQKSHNEMIQCLSAIR